MVLRKSMILDSSPLHESLLKMDLQFHNLLVTDLSAHINIDHFYSWWEPVGESRNLWLSSFPI